MKKPTTTQNGISNGSSTEHPWPRFKERYWGKPAHRTAFDAVDMWWEWRGIPIARVNAWRAEVTSLTNEQIDARKRIRDYALPKLAVREIALDEATITLAEHLLLTAGMSRDDVEIWRRHEEFHISVDVERSPYGEAFHKSQQWLVSALRHGHLNATGLVIVRDDDARAELPSRQALVRDWFAMLSLSGPGWRDRPWSTFDSGKSQILLYEGGSKSREEAVLCVKEISLSLTELEGHFPSVFSASVAIEPDVASYRTGAPGRPSSMHLIEREALRRTGALTQFKSLSEFSRALAGWIRKAYPDAPSPTPKAIANRLRAFWHEHVPK